MATWLELIFNILGYGGFVVLASCHRGPETIEAGPESNAAGAAGPCSD